MFIIQPFDVDHFRVDLPQKRSCRSQQLVGIPRGVSFAGRIRYWFSDLGIIIPSWAVSAATRRKKYSKAAVAHGVLPRQDGWRVAWADPGRVHHCHVRVDLAVLKRKPDHGI